jgi:putative flippase GtrA
MLKILKMLKKLKEHTELRRFMQYLLVGLSGTLLDFAVLAALKYFLHVSTLPANFISYSCGILNNFLLSRYWVYPESQHSQQLPQLLRFTLVSMMGLMLNTLIVAGLESSLGMLLGSASLGYVPAKILATVLVLFWNFFANRFWTFGESRQHSRQPLESPNF